jgi:hypothetical protein
MTHYWGNKGGYQPDIDRQLARFLCHGMAPEAAAGYVRDHPIEHPVVLRQRFWTKALAHLAGRAARAPRRP